MNNQIFFLILIAFCVLILGCTKDNINEKKVISEVEIMDNYDGGTPFIKVANPINQNFYKDDGSFDSEKATKSYFDMMKAFHYPISENLKNQFWCADFLTGEFASLGMGGIFWVNESGVYSETGTKSYKGKYSDEKFGYLGHDIYLLPKQVLPEHHHIGGPEGYAPKMESWRIINGSITFFGEYDSGNGERLISELPKSEQPWGYGNSWFKSKYYVTKKAGEVYTLQDPESWHGQMAGANGAIVAEYATFHNHVSFSRPGMEFGSTEKNNVLKK